MDLSSLCVTTKTYHDVVHGYIGLTMFALQIIDTLIFQRLANLKQLGPCRFVYPNAVHTRYEHSIGTYHLAGELMSTIAGLDNQADIDSYLITVPELHHYFSTLNITNTPNKMNHLLTPYVRELVKIAALCHDIGHGPFSHLFDDIFLPAVDSSDNPNKSHEARSNTLIEMVIKQNPNLSNVHDDDIKFIQSLINPEAHHSGFIYQIVSNTLNGLDVDKIDYLQRDIKMVDFQAKLDATRMIKYIRVIDNCIVYPKQSIDDIENLFRTRHRMYKNVYNHKTVSAVQSIIIEIMLELNKIMDIANSINDMNKFITLNDNTILECVNVIDKMHTTLTPLQQEVYNKVKVLLHKIYTRQFNSVIHTITSKNKLDVDKLIESVRSVNTNPKVQFNNILVSQHKVGFLSGKKPNPFDTIYFYDSKNPNKIVGTIEAFCKSKPVLSSTGTHQEYVTILFYKDRNELEIIDELKYLFKNVCID